MTQLLKMALLPAAVSAYGGYGSVGFSLSLEPVCQRPYVSDIRPRDIRTPSGFSRASKNSSKS